MMKATTAFLFLLLITGAAMAQEGPARPDYSREAVQRFVMSMDVDEDEIQHEYDPMAVNFAAFGTTWRVGLPQAVMPLSGSMMNGVTQTFPDPFALTRTSIATSPRAWRTQRAHRAELRRINRLSARIDTN